MKALIVYDSNFGNTKIIAEEIAKKLGKDAKTVFVSDTKDEDFKNVDMLIVGSPINGWRPSPRTISFLDSLKKGQLKGVRATSFDTRINIFFHGDAAKKISLRLEEAGAEIITDPQVFFVKSKEGPIVDGEIEKAKQWANDIIKIKE